MSKSPNPDIIDKIYFRNIYSCQRKIYWYKVKVMETINAVWEHSYGEDCIPNFSANMEQPRHRWYEFKEGFSLTLVERAIRETKKDNKSTSFTVLDPFSGSGTSPLTALQSRCNAIGYEVNPFMSFVGKTKCQQRTKSIHDYTKELNRILVQRPFRLKSPLEGVSTFTGSGENGKWLFNLDVLRAYEALYQHISLSEYKDFFLLALITSAMQCCNAKKDGKCLRYLKNWKALNYTGANLRDTFKANALQMISDLERSPLLEGTRDSILEYKLDNETQDPRNYEDDVVRLANLNNYAQFVFLQLKVLTFDESRDCLFWNPSILTPTIFLCLGESVDNAERADELAREIQKVNSRIRNVQWEISKQSARLTTLIEEKSKTEEARPHYASEILLMLPP